MEQSRFSRAMTGRCQVGLKQTGKVEWSDEAMQGLELQWRTPMSRHWWRVGRIALMRLMKGLGSIEKQVAPLNETGVAKKEWGQIWAPLFEQVGLVEGAGTADRREFLYLGSFAMFFSLDAIRAIAS